MLQDVGLMGKAAIAQHPQIEPMTGGAFQSIHQARLVWPTQPFLPIVQYGDVDIAIGAEARGESAAIEENGRNGQGLEAGENRPAACGQLLDPLLHGISSASHGWTYYCSVSTARANRIIRSMNSLAAAYACGLRDPSKLARKVSATSGNPWRARRKSSKLEGNVSAGLLDLGEREELGGGGLRGDDLDLPLPSARVVFEGILTADLLHGKKDIPGRRRAAGGTYGRRSCGGGLGGNRGSRSGVGQTLRRSCGPGTFVSRWSPDS